MMPAAHERSSCARSLLNSLPAGWAWSRDTVFLADPEWYSQRPFKPAARLNDRTGIGTAQHRADHRKSYLLGEEPTTLNSLNIGEH